MNSTHHPEMIVCLIYDRTLQVMKQQIMAAKEQLYQATPAASSFNMPSFAYEHAADEHSQQYYDADIGSAADYDNKHSSPIVDDASPVYHHQTRRIAVEDDFKSPTGLHKVFYEDQRKEPIAATTTTTSEAVEDVAILDNWRRENEHIRRELEAVKQQIQAAELNNSSPLLHNLNTPRETPLASVVNPPLVRLGNREEVQKRLREENRSLNSIVAQVKRDLEQAAMTSPAIIGGK